MKTWFLFMTLFLAPFWTFGKEKSEDQAEIDKGEEKVPGWGTETLVIEVVGGEVKFLSPLTKEEYRLALDPSSGELVVLPLNDEDSFYLPDELEQNNNAIDDDEFINYLNRLGVLNKAKIDINQPCKGGR